MKQALLEPQGSCRGQTHKPQRGQRCVGETKGLERAAQDQPLTRFRETWEAQTALRDLLLLPWPEDEATEN